MLWLVLSALVCVLIYFLTIKPLNYWKNRGVAYDKPWPILGNMLPLFLKRKSFLELSQDSYNAFSDKRYNGTFQFTKPVLIIRDADLVKQITVKDFDYFTDHNNFVSVDADPLMGKNLFLLKGQHWRDMRNTLSPTFTGSKMRAMFTLISDCAEQFTKHFQKQNPDGVLTLEMKDIFTRFTNDAIASIAFGLKVDSLEEKDNEFYKMGKSATSFTGIRVAKFFLASASPGLAKLLKLKFFPESVGNFFRRIVKETIQQRELEGLVRPDMIHLLMEARKGRLVNDHGKDNIDAGFATVEESHIGKAEKHQKVELSDDDITAQALIFFFAGFETSATLMCFLAHELAVNPEIQEKLQEEIDHTLKKCEGKITYEALLGMKYLDNIVSETLRKWPPVFQLDRICVKNYTIEPINTSEKPLSIGKGDLLIIPVYAIHRDPNYFPNPEKFEPERFNEENKHSIEPASYIPFGFGPRNCIASRLALLENKTLLFHLLSQFDIVPVEKTPIPLRVGTGSFNMMPDEGFWLGFQQRKLTVLI